MKKLSVLLWVVLLAFAIMSAQAQDEPELKEATLLLNWTPYGEHVGFYYGLDQGFYEEAGIDLTIQTGGGSVRTVQALAANQATFGYADTPALINAVNQGADIRSLGVFLQSTPSAIQFFCDAGIETIEDMAGKSIAITAGDTFSQTLPALLEANGMSIEDVQTVNLDPSGKTAALLAGRVDTLAGFANGQAPTIETVSGRDVCLLPYPELGMNFLSLGLLTNTATIAEDPELVEAFVQASIRSWTAAAQNIEEASQTMAARVVEAPSVEELRLQWALTTELFHTEATEGMPLAVNAEEDWQNTLDIMMNYMGLEEAQELSAYWEPQFAATMVEASDDAGTDETEDENENEDENEDEDENEASDES